MILDLAITATRRPGLEPGPITTGVSREKDSGSSLRSHRHWWLWVPAQGRDDVDGEWSVIARSEATKQSILPLRGEMDCFAEPVTGRRFAPTRWRAMTIGNSITFPRRDAPEVLTEFAALQNRGRRESRVRGAPAARVQW